MRLIPLLFVLLLQTGAVLGEEAVSLKGQLIQGGIIIGKTAPGSQILLDGQALRVSAVGDFVFGFDRDAEPQALLTVIAPGQAPLIQKLEIARRDYDIQKIEGVEQKYVSPPKEVTERISRDAQLVAAARKDDIDKPMFASGFSWPAQGRISGVYGSQRVFNGVPKRPHYGVDVAAPVGTPILAPAEGIVTLAEPDLYYSGGTVILDHGHGLSSTFLHMDSVTVRVGEYLKSGDQLGTLGATGRVTGPHLDWRMNWFEQRVDPQTLVEAMPQ
ncbi:M23 family metallopeptidase [Kiloniella laminariae]|uniref:M23 family metallopeptidase n=1 Tax=Kiloniella laminariae TaxID=454162 RepID=A0ABT4LKW4_9PROT|nr:M23 family metallopeptidase [Kiloniella laminariae]MCZ4281752.1 M23 family metallopeptidase [Kiloniella laminariae]